MKVITLPEYGTAKKGGCNIRIFVCQNFIQGGTTLAKNLKTYLFMDVYLDYPLMILNKFAPFFCYIANCQSINFLFQSILQILAIIASIFRLFSEIAHPILTYFFYSRLQMHNLQFSHLFCGETEIRLRCCSSMIRVNI